MIQQPIAHGKCQSHVPVVAGCHFGQSALGVEEVIENVGLNRLDTGVRVNLFWLLCDSGGCFFIFLHNRIARRGKLGVQTKVELSTSGIKTTTEMLPYLKR